MGDAYRTVGISITYGAATTFCAAAPQTLCVLPAAYKLGILMIATIACSFFTAKFLFGALMHIYGKEGDVTCIDDDSPKKEIKDLEFNQV